MKTIKNQAFEIEITKDEIRSFAAQQIQKQKY